MKVEVNQQDIDRPFFSVITVAKNAGSTLQRCMTSVRNQVKTNVEHIIVDGLSDDNTMQIVEGEQARLDSKLSHFVSEPDSGIYQAMNKGLRLARGEWIYYLNADDILFDPGTLSNAQSLIIKNKCDVLYGRLLCLNTSDGSASIHAPRAVNIYRLMSGGMYQQAWTFRREWTGRVGNFDESLKLCGDIDYLMRLVHAKAVIKIAPILLAVFYQGGASSDFKKVKQEHAAVEKRYCHPLKRTGFKIARNAVRIANRVIRTNALSMLD